MVLEDARTPSGAVVGRAGSPALPGRGRGTPAPPTPPPLQRLRLHLPFTAPGPGAGGAGVRLDQPATHPPAIAGARTVRLGGRSIAVVGPSWRDPRLQVAAVIVAVQVLGQTSLHFQVSIAQILVSVLTCAALEVAITLWRR